MIFIDALLKKNQETKLSSLKKSSYILKIPSSLDISVWNLKMTRRL
jgi:hypothetical protein